MGKNLLKFAALLAIFLTYNQTGNAQVPINVTIGNPALFTDGTKVAVGTFNTAVGAQPAPFNAYTGSDVGTGPDFSGSWTFSYSVPSGDTISSASLVLGILDIDSAATGNQVGSFILDGTDDLTSLLNVQSEALNAGAGSANSFYNVLTITIPTADLSDLADGSATFALTLQGPGLGVLGNTTFNGAGLDFSTLNMEAMGPISPTPEPTTWVLFLAGMACFAIKFLSRKFA
jgi:hypothetical protein